MSEGRRAVSSATRSPDRYSSISIARFRIPVGAFGEHWPMIAATSAGVSTSGGYLPPLFGGASARARQLLALIRPPRR